MFSEHDARIITRENPSQKGRDEVERKELNKDEQMDHLE